MAQMRQRLAASPLAQKAAADPGFMRCDNIATAAMLHDLRAVNTDLFTHLKGRGICSILMQSRNYVIC